MVSIDSEVYDETQNLSADNTNSVARFNATNRRNQVLCVTIGDLICPK